MRRWRLSLKPADKTARAIGLLGLCAKAGRVVVGVPLICTALQTGAKNKTPLVVLLAEGCAPNTTKRITDRTTFYGVPLIRLPIDTAALAHAVGKRDAAVAAVGVTEEHLAAAILAAMKEEI